MIIATLFQVKIVIIDKFISQNIINIFLYRVRIKTYLLNMINYNVKCIVKILK